MNQNSTLNVPRLTQLAEWLEKGAPHKYIKFSMDKWIALRDRYGDCTTDTGEACGAVCCMAGAAAQFFAGETLKARTMKGRHFIKPEIVSEVARVALGLDYQQAKMLFTPMSFARVAITPQQAGKVVRHLIETGKVDWRVAGYEYRW